MKSSNAWPVFRQRKQHKARGTLPTHPNGIKASKCQGVKEFATSGTLKTTQAKLDNPVKKYWEEGLGLEIEVKKSEWYAILRAYSAVSYTKRVNSICAGINHELAAHVMFSLPTLVGRACGDAITGVLCGRLVKTKVLK